jgi:membrane protease YdiL (CAAX protease family)
MEGQAAPPPTCSYCGGRLAASASFCPSCGQEREGYAEWFRREPPPPPPDFSDRLRLQGQPAVRMLVAVVAALAASLVATLVLFAGSLERSFSKDTVQGLILASDLLLGVAISACAWKERRTLARLFRPGAWGWWVLAPAIAIALPLIAQGWEWAIRQIAPGVEEGHDPFSDLPTGFAVLSICVFPGIFEEIAFRGVFLDATMAMMRRRSAQLTTAAVFAGVHLRLIEFPYLFLVGLYLGIVRAKSNSLWPGMLAHGAHNAAVIFLYT